MSQEVIGAVVILLMSVLQMLGVVIERDAIAGIVTGIVAIWIWYRRVQKGDVNAFGLRR